MALEIDVYVEEERVQAIEEDCNVYLDVNRYGVTTYGSTTVSLAADDTIPATYDVVFLSGDGGHVTLTNTPTIAAGNKGQRLTLIGEDDAATVTLQDNTSLAGSLLYLEYSRDVTLGHNDVLDLIYNGTGWIRRGSSDNA